MTSPTEFAPAERASADILQKQAASLSRQPLLLAGFNAMLNYVLLLNEQRQILFCSDNFLNLLPPDRQRLLGMRPGEALRCIHAETCSDCGTTTFCRDCGAVRAILGSQEGKRQAEECRLVRQVGDETEALDLRVNAVPIEIDGYRYSLISLADISHEKRNRALDRIFFHDVLNTAGGILGLASLLAAEAPAELTSDLEVLRNGLDAVVEEILAQRDLAAAESNELVADVACINVRDLLEAVVAFYRRHPVAADYTIRLNEVPATLQLSTDPRLLKRVIGNLIKNAVEASREDGCVTVGCEDCGDDIELSVHNETTMSETTRRQVFSRSFSTKGKDRGLGSYSVRLLTQRYLKGQVRFTSSESSGTTFYVRLPKNIS